MRILVACRKNFLMLAMWLLATAMVQPALAQTKPAPGLSIAMFSSDATPPMGYDMGYSVVRGSASRCRSRAS